MTIITEKSPTECNDMTQVRRGVDAIDAALVQLLGQRFRYMEAAARIKDCRDQVRDERRKAEVISNVIEQARLHGVPVPVAAALWQDLVEASIAHELAEWSRIHT